MSVFTHTHTKFTWKFSYVVDNKPFLRVFRLVGHSDPKDNNILRATNSTNKKEGKQIYQRVLRIGKCKL